MSFGVSAGDIFMIAKGVLWIYERCFQDFSKASKCLRGLQVYIAQYRGSFHGLSRRTRSRRLVSLHESEVIPGGLHFSFCIVLLLSSTNHLKKLAYA